MHALIRHLQSVARAEQLFPEPGPVVVATSGGADSTALLLGMCEIAPRLGLEPVVAHLDHGLRPDEGADDAAAVVELGGNRGLPVEIGVTDPSRGTSGSNLEEAARETRYDFLGQVARRHGASVIAVGHTADDQAETLLMRLLRGAGPRGLAAMTPLSTRPGVRVVRPLLGLPRSVIESYLVSQQVVARLDRTNHDISITRNRVRHILVPMVRRQFNPRIIETLGRTADLMAEIDRYLDERGEDILTDGVLRHPGSGASGIGEAIRGVEEGRDPCIAGARTDLGADSDADSGADGNADKVELDLPRLASYDPILQRYALRSALRQLRGDLRGIGYQHIDALVRLYQPGATGYMVELPGGLVGLREGHTLSLWSAAPTPAEHVDPVELRVPGVTEIPGSRLTVTTHVFATPDDWRRRDEEACTAWFDYSALELPLVVRSRRPGDRILGLGLPRETKTKNLLIDAGIPRRLREAVPMLTDRSRILWIAGVRRSAHALLQDGTEQVLEVKLSSPTFKRGHS